MDDPLHCYWIIIEPVSPAIFSGTSSSHSIGIAIGIGIDIDIGIGIGIEDPTPEVTVDWWAIR